MDTRTNLNLRKTFRRLGGPHINILRILRLVCVPIAKFIDRFAQSMRTKLSLDIMDIIWMIFVICTVNLGRKIE